MKKEKLILAFCFVIVFLASCHQKIQQKALNDKKYNVVLILADDVGWSDLTCYGNKFIETPNLDALAKSGVRFINGYAAAPLCSPSRASIITGNNPARINLTEHLHGYTPAGPNQKLITPKIESVMPPQLVTIPEALANAGYTSGHFGKWHLGTGSSLPANQGFTTSYGGGAEGLPKTFFYPFFWGKPYPDLLADTKEGDYLDDALTNKAMQFIEQHKAQSFFVSLNFYSAHVPIEGKPALVKKYQQKRKETGFTGLPEDEYAAMVENIDYNVGRLVSYLKSAGLEKNTLVIFTSDNGGLNVQEVPAFAKHTPPTTNTPLKGGKGYIYEGGIREPFIVSLPGVIKKGLVSNQIVSSDDVFNTVMNFAGSPAKSPDGVSFLPVLLGQKMPQRDYHLHFPHYSPQHGKPGAVLRSGDFKLIEWYETGQKQLFNLASDFGEENDLASKMPEKVKELAVKLDNWRKSVDAKMPIPNPEYKGK